MSEIINEKELNEVSGGTAAGASAPRLMQSRH